MPMVDSDTDDVTFEEAVRLDSRKRCTRAFRGLLQEAEPLTRTVSPDILPSTPRELAIQLLAILDHEDVIARDIAIFVLRNMSHRCFRLSPGHNLEPDLEYFTGRDIARPELLTKATRSIFYLEQLMAGTDPGPDGWEVILADPERTSLLDEAIDRGVSLPTDALDGYFRGRLVEHDGDPLEYEADWPSAREVSELLAELSAGFLNSLPRLIELQATEWAESLRAWVLSAQEVQLPPRDLLRRRGLWRALVGALPTLTREGLGQALRSDADTRDFALWSSHRTCRGHLYAHRWDAAARTAEDLRSTPCLGGSTCDAHAWSSSALAIARLAQEDFASALEALRAECEDEPDRTSAETRRLNLALLEKWGRIPGVYRTIDLISPYTLLGRDEGTADMSTARMDQLRILGRDPTALLSINVADERLRGAQKDYAGIEDWVHLPATPDPEPRDGLTWSIPRLTPRISESDLEQRRQSAWTSLLDELRVTIEVRLGDEWHTWADVVTDGGSRG